MVNDLVSKYLNQYNYRCRKLEEGFLFFSINNGDLLKISEKYFFILERSLTGKDGLSDDEISISQKIQRLIESPSEKTFPKRESTPFHIQWHLNESCNLRCKHCYHENYLNTNQLEFQEIKKIVDHIFIAVGKWGQEPEFALTGGEPLLREDLFEIISYIKSKKDSTSISLLTNGTLITPKIANQIKSSGINSVQLSLEGSTSQLNDSIRGKGVYDKVLNSLRLLKENGSYVNFHFVLSNMNKHDLIDYIQLCKNLKVDSLTISRLVPIGNAEKIKDFIVEPKELKEIFEKINNLSNKLISEGSNLKIKQTRTLWCMFNSPEKGENAGGYCPVGINTLTIMSNGDVLPCRRLPLKVGNLTCQSLFEIWYDNDLLWELRNKNKIDGCGKCRFIEQCGGCRALSFAFFGKTCGADPQCWLINDKIGDFYSKNDKQRI